jgi:hypothetical protein
MAGNVAASTQNQALNALVFLYEQVLQMELGNIGEFARVTRPARLPEVLTQEQTRRVLAALKPGTSGVIIRLLYGTGSGGLGRGADDGRADGFIGTRTLTSTHLAREREIHHLPGRQIGRIELGRIELRLAGLERHHQSIQATAQQRGRPGEQHAQCLRGVLPFRDAL